MAPLGGRDGKARELRQCRSLVSRLSKDYDGFEWDVAKSTATLAVRGIAFDFARRVFESCYRQRADSRHEYGEPRYLVTGQVDGIVLTLVRTPRQRARRIITAWPASKREERDYREHCSEVHPKRPQGEG